MKRYTLKLGVALVSLAAASSGVACAQSHEGTTETDKAFQLAMAAYNDASPATPPIPVTASATAVPIVADGAVAATRPKPPVQGPVATATTPGPDGLVEGGAYIEADDMHQLADKTVIAIGHVEMRYKGKTIRADQVSYNPDTKVTIASGHTVTINDDGSVQFADYATFDNDLNQGTSNNFADLGADQTKIFARRVDRVNENTNQMHDIVYTPCDLCASKGVTQPPTWSISASRITQRKDKKMVYYDNATIQVKGVPIFYAPFLWTPDPEMPRASGLLQPKPGYSRKRGFSLEQPYLQILDPYSYVIIDPQFNSKVNPLLSLEYERKFYSGTLNVRFGFTNDRFFDNTGKKYGESETRDYLIADGAFKINKDWRWSFTAEHAKDPSQTIDPVTGKPFNYANFFERYSIEDAFDQRGELTVDARELINQVNLTRQTPTSFFAVSMANFETLQIGGYADPGINYQPITLDSDIFPTVAPMVEAYWSPKSDIFGGQFTASLNGIGIQQKVYPGDAVAPPVEVATCATAASPSACKTGFDTARVTAGVSWSVDKVWGTSGFKGGPFFDLRHDYYHETDLDSAGLATSAQRDLGTAGFNISYPLFRKFKGFDMVVEPLAQLAVSPKYQVDPDIPTEDSQSLEFDETNLFSTNRSPGFDVYESGARLNLGVRTNFTFDKGMKINTLVGRVLRNDVQTQFLRPAIDPTNGATATDPSTGATVNYDPYGLAYKSSDWIFDGDFDTGKGFYGFSRVRLDGDTLRLKQGEAGASIATSRTEGTIRYIVNNTNPVVVNGRLTSIFGPNYRDLQLYVRHFITKNWGVSARLDRDLLLDKWRRSTISAIYRDDCIWIEVIYERNDTILNTVNGKPQSGFLLQIKPVILGLNGATKFQDVR